MEKRILWRLIVVAMVLVLCGMLRTPVSAASQTWHFTDSDASGSYLQTCACVNPPGDCNNYMTAGFTSGTPASISWDDSLKGTNSAYWYAEDPALVDMVLDNTGWTLDFNWASVGNGTIGTMDVYVVKVSDSGAEVEMASYTNWTIPAGQSGVTSLTLVGSGTTAFSAAAGDRLAFRIDVTVAGKPKTFTLNFNSATYDSAVTSPNSDPGYPVPDAGAWLMFAAGALFLVWVVWRIRRRDTITST